LEQGVFTLKAGIYDDSKTKWNIEMTFSFVGSRFKDTKVLNVCLYISKFISFLS